MKMSNGIKYKVFKLFFILLFVSSLSKSANTEIIPYDKGVVIAADSFRMKIEVIAPTIIHILSTPLNHIENSSLVVNGYNVLSPKWEISKTENEINIITNEVTINYSHITNDLKFYHDGKLILSETSRSYIPISLDSIETFSIEQKFKISPSEAIYGLGQHHNGIMNYRNHSVELIQSNTEVAIPFIVSSKSYGLLWDNYSKTTFNDDSTGMSFKSEIADKIDYYFILADDINQTISQYRELTGNAPLFPRWAYGYFQSRNRYWSQEELLSTVEKYRNLSIPLDVIVLDYLHWGEYGFGSFQFDKIAFPNPKQMIDRLHNEFNCKLMISVWPSFSKRTPNWEKMNSQGFLLDVDSYDDTQVYDAYNPDAGKFYWKLLEQSYYDLGVDGWWLDATEPERMSEYINSNNFLGNSQKYLNTYSLMDVKNIYNGQREASSANRVFILTRSAFAGQQKYAASTWSGDIKPTFESFKSTIPAGLNFCMSGLPYWTSDIGGYKGGDPDDPKYQELYIRWFQYGAFCPIFRAHGRRAPGDRKTPNAVWSYGKTAKPILSKFIDLRYRLMPYIYSLAWEITSEGNTLMRPLVFDFNYDKIVFDIEDQFMFGSSLMINPVVKEKASSRKIYLPAKSEWIDFWTGEIYKGGKTINIDTPIDRIPILVKSGSIIPMGPFMQYSTEKPADPIELRIYGNDDAEFTLYEDENNNYNYEQGIYSTIKIKWKDKKRTLTFNELKGNYPGMLEERIFHIIVVNQKHGLGIEIENNIDKIVHYIGKKIEVNIK